MNDSVLRVRGYRKVKIGDLRMCLPGQKVCVSARAEITHVVVSQYGNRMGFLRLEDEAGISGGVLFPKAFELYEDTVENATEPLLFFGVVQGPPYTDTLMIHGVDSF